MENYNKKSEQNIIELVKLKEETDKRMLALEVVICIISVACLLGFCAIAAYLEMEVWIRVVLIVSGFVLSLFGLTFAIRIEQIAGYYQCAHCGNKYVPSFASVLFAMHMGRTRYMKCPECKRRSWQKKVISKE